MQNHVALPKALATKQCVIGISYHSTRYFLCFYILFATIKTIRKPINDLFNDFSIINKNPKCDESRKTVHHFNILLHILHRPS